MIVMFWVHEGGEQWCNSRKGVKRVYRLKGRLVLSGPDGETTISSSDLVDVTPEPEADAQLSDSITETH